jgi:hypothetical protein
MQTIKHMRPRYYGYRAGAYSNVRACRGCGALSLVEDEPLSKPCSHCGWRATPNDVYAMRWVSTAVWWNPATWLRGEWRAPE